MDQKRDERRLVKVSPAEMVAARHVVELVAEIAVPVIEVDVQDEFGYGDGPDEGHAGREEVAAVGIWLASSAHIRGHKLSRIAESGLARLRNRRILSSSFQVRLYLNTLTHPPPTT